ncbi:phenylalanine 4-monooxygenase [uncultured Paludibaculum sp.]|uniref:phenylalanine 4-monooxygenase n=1 Tax=uncultured Paludibaculum sp. TaxID=1765020 RepID=UPI002AAA915E|nr:phenylalanine 4-monooxygenase [uncultured Paludibaculum sp.]
MLTTTAAPFVEEARDRHELFIRQPYELYSAENHAAWQSLFARMQPSWARYANPHFLNGLDTLHLDPVRVPRLEDVNHFLAPLTGFRARAVSGYVPPFLFFDCLRRREFPTTVTIRALDSLDYLPEPDIFHDIAGHVPMHTHRDFAETLVRFGDCAHTAAAIASGIADKTVRLERLASIVKGMARFFWFTVEFGLMRDRAGLRAYGSGLLSSCGELPHAVESAEVQRSQASLEWMIHQSFEIDHYQPLLFVVEGFEHLYELVGKLEEWMLAGKLDHVAPGEPALSLEDLRSFCLG